MGLKKFKEKLEKDVKEGHYVNPHRKYMIRGFLLSMGGFLILLIPYITFVAPFVLIAGGWYLAKWKYNVDVKEEITETGETYDKEHSSNLWKNTDNGI